MAYIDVHRDRFGIEPICAQLQVAPSVYYAAKARPLSARAVRDAVLTPEIRRVHEARGGVYGARKVYKQLRRDHVHVASRTVERLMADLGLAGVVRGAPKRITPPPSCRSTGSGRRTRPVVSSAGQHLRPLAF